RSRWSRSARPGRSGCATSWASPNDPLPALGSELHPARTVLRRLWQLEDRPLRPQLRHRDHVTRLLPHDRAGRLMARRLVALLPVKGIPRWFARVAHWLDARRCNRIGHQPRWVLEVSVVACNRCGQILDPNPDATRYRLIDPEAW